MFLTNVLLKKVKSKYVMVMLRSTGSSHTRTSFRERLDPKKEIIAFDPYIEMECVYKEEKKLRSMKRELTLKKDKSESLNFDIYQLKVMKNESNVESK